MRTRDRRGSTCRGAPHRPPAAPRVREMTRAERGRDAGPDEEKAWIRSVQKEFYSDIKGMPAPVSQENFKNWGCSTTPTLALISRDGEVAMYHPGKMPYEELAPKVAAIVGR